MAALDCVQGQAISVRSRTYNPPHVTSFMRVILPYVSQAIDGSPVPEEEARFWFNPETKQTLPWSALVSWPFV